MGGLGLLAVERLDARLALEADPWKRPWFAAKAATTSESERISRPLIVSTPTGAFTAIWELTAWRSTRVSTTTLRSA